MFITATRLRPMPKAQAVSLLIILITQAPPPGHVMRTITRQIAAVNCGFIAQQTPVPDVT